MKSTYRQPTWGESIVMALVIVVPVTLVIYLINCLLRYMGY